MLQILDPLRFPHPATAVDLDVRPIHDVVAFEALTDLLRHANRRDIVGLNDTDDVIGRDVLPRPQLTN